jgi:Polyketide cyclase / dehydrase and lipid transport
MTVDVQTDIVINRPVIAVATYAADPSNAPEWYDRIDSVEWNSTSPPTQGTRVAFIARFLGRRLAYTYQFVDFVPGEHLVMRTAEGPFPMETTYTWSETSTTSTRMTLRNRGQPAGFAKALAPFIVPAMRRANRKDLVRIKTILEST